MKKLNRNIKLVAENVENGRGFNIYLNLSGRKEYLMWHRHNGLLYGMIKDGICLDDARRWTHGNGSPVKGRSLRDGSRASRLLDNSVRHIVNAADVYLMELEAC